MAQITLITESLTPMGPHTQDPWKLAQVFSQQGHEVTVMTSFSEDPPIDHRINVMRPFVHWSWAEAVTLLPRLISSPPDILLLVQPEALSQRRLFHPLYFFLSALKHLPKIEVACYLHQPIDSRASSSFLEFLRSADTLVFSDQSIMWELNRKVPPSGRARRRVIPSDQHASASPALNLTESEQECLTLIAKFKNRVLVPLPLARMQNSETLISFARASNDTLFVILDGWQGMSKREQRIYQGRLHSLGLEARVFITGSGSDGLLYEAARLARAILLTPIELSHLEHEFFHQLSLGSQTPAILDHHQAQDATEFWKENQNCAILRKEQPARHFAKMMEENSALPLISPEQSTQVRLRSSDESVNLWSRLFAEPDGQYVR